MNFRRISALLVAGLALVVVTAAAIYLTPLKNIAVIEPSIRDIDPQEIYARMSAHPEQYVFVDVRPPDMYAHEHAKGAININLPMLYYERYDLPKTGKTIVLICNEGVASGVAYSYLEHYGFLNLYRVHDGMQNWNQEKLPVESSSPSS